LAVREPEHGFIAAHSLHVFVTLPSLPILLVALMLVKAKGKKVAQFSLMMMRDRIQIGVTLMTFEFTAAFLKMKKLSYARMRHCGTR
jgi:hypothetical protein